jgi:hypothetical protein
MQAQIKALPGLQFLIHKSLTASYAFLLTNPDCLASFALLGLLDDPTNAEDAPQATE